MKYLIGLALFTEHESVQEPVRDELFLLVADAVQLELVLLLAGVAVWLRILIVALDSLFKLYLGEHL